MAQLKDGRWVPAHPIPFHADTRPWHVRLWHAFLVVFCNRDEDELTEKWWVPMEPGCDQRDFPRG